MINIINIKNGLPISVIVPLQEKRKDFFFNYTLPLIKANNPSEIIINTNDGMAGNKRNQAFDKSTCPYIFCCDDDILLPECFLGTLYNNIKNDKECGYVYTGYNGIVLNSDTNNLKNNFVIETIDFNQELLKSCNYISTMSLMKRNIFPYFDEMIPRFLDYDLYMNLLSKGIIGKAVHGIKFYAFFLDDGITSINNPFSYSEIQSKYKL